MIHALVAQLAGRAKGTSSYRVDKRIPARSLLAILLRRSAMVLRGAARSSTWARREGAAFVGRHVNIRDAHLLRAGSGVLIEDFVSIEALSTEGVTLGNGVTISRFATIRATGVLGNLGVGFVIGDGSSLGEYCYIGAAGGVTIGKNVLVGQRVSFHAENHNFDDPHRPIKEQGVTRRGITVEDDCWIGSGAIILDGVTVGEGSVVAAGAVVTGSIPPYSVAGGVPARVLRQRGECIESRH